MSFLYHKLLFFHIVQSACDSNLHWQTAAALTTQITYITDRYIMKDNVLYLRIAVVILRYDVISDMMHAILPLKTVYYYHYVSTLQSDSTAHINTLLDIY